MVVGASRCVSHGTRTGGTRSGASMRFTVGCASDAATSRTCTVRAVASFAIVSCAVSPGTYEGLSSVASAERTRTIGLCGFVESRESRPYCRKLFPQASVMSMTYVVGSIVGDGRQVISCQPRFTRRRTDQAGCAMRWKFRWLACARIVTRAEAVT